MKAAAIIAEFNPLHNGHKYLIEQAKNECGADYVVIIMSGDFVQRGAPAFFDKYTRTEMALAAGADLVLELPVHYSASSAEYFAGASAAIADRLGVITHLIFGSECGNIELLSQAAKIIGDEPEEYKESLKRYLREGNSYPLSRNYALSDYLGPDSALSSLVSSPNNILGIEYIKALNTRNSSIHTVTVKRQGSDYHSEDIEDAGADVCSKARFGSAKAIRSVLSGSDTLSNIEPQMPAEALRVLREIYLSGRRSITSNDLSLLMQYKLLELSKSGFEEYADVTPDISDRIKKELKNYADFNSFCDLLKTKNVTHSRISRALLHILLGIKISELNGAIADDYLGYVSLLGFRKESSDLLSAIKKNTELVILSKNADAIKLLSERDQKIFDANIRASQLYEALVHNKYGCNQRNMYKMSPIII